MIASEYISAFAAEVSPTKYTAKTPAIKAEPQRIKTRIKNIKNIKKQKIKKT